MSQQITRSIIVKASTEQAYQAWANFENFPMFMKYVKAVHKTADGKSHWEIEGPMGKTVEWEAFTTTNEPNKRIGWNTKDTEGDITTSGQVTFNSLPNNETEVTILMQYDPPAGIAGDIVSKLFAKPEEMVETDLSNFKSYIEGMSNRTGGTSLA